MMFSGFVGFCAMLGSACLFVGNGPEWATFTCRSVDVTPDLAREACPDAAVMTKMASPPTTNLVSLRVPLIGPPLMDTVRRYAAVERWSNAKRDRTGRPPRMHPRTAQADLSRH